MQFDREGWLVDAEHCLSPNHNHRPNPDDVSLLVIHNISLPPGQYGTGCVTDFFCNQLDVLADPFFNEIKDLKVSAHLLVERSGKVVQFVSTVARAWHAGVSVFEGRTECNDFSVGIELEGCDHEPYTDDQYKVLTQLANALMQRHAGITPERIVGHCHIAPGRKTDPGEAFDWQRFFTALGCAHLSEPAVQVIS